MSAGATTIRKPLIGFSLFAIIALLLTYITHGRWNGRYPATPTDTPPTSAMPPAFASGDDVRMVGVRVGRVSSIDLDDGRAKVTFEVQTNQPMYTTTKAAIRYQNLIGQRYLALSLADGDAQPLPVGSTLSSRRRTPSTSPICSPDSSRYSRR